MILSLEDIVSQRLCLSKIFSFKDYVFIRSSTLKDRSRKDSYLRWSVTRDTISQRFCFLKDYLFHFQPLSFPHVVCLLVKMEDSVPVFYVLSHHFTTNSLKQEHVRMLHLTPCPHAELTTFPKNFSVDQYAVPKIIWFSAEKPSLSRLERKQRHNFHPKDSVCPIYDSISLHWCQQNLILRRKTLPVTAGAETRRYVLLCGT